MDSRAPGVGGPVSNLPMYPPELDLRPTSNSAELHLLYQCNLDCLACTRGSFLSQPPVPPMTIADVHEFIRQARELNWIPGIVITGGEPTLHPDFLEIVSIATEFTRSSGYGPDARPTPQNPSASGNLVRIFSNAYTEKSRRLIDEANARYGASIVRDTWKLGGTVTGPAMYPGWVDDVFVSPTDLGKPLRAPCYQSASQICGVSVDSQGYSPCSPGGGLGALLGVGKTTRLADLWDRETVARLSAELCRHCGSQATGMNILTREEVDAQEKRFGAPMSPTWVKAFDGRK